MTNTEIFNTGFNILLGLLGYLLVQKDTKQGELIERIRENMEKLSIQLASEHYPKPEVDRMLKEFKGYLNEKFESLERAMDFRRRKEDKE